FWFQRPADTSTVRPPREGLEMGSEVMRLRQDRRLLKQLLVFSVAYPLAELSIVGLLKLLGGPGELLSAILFAAPSIILWPASFLLLGLEHVESASFAAAFVAVLIAANSIWYMLVYGVIVGLRELRRASSRGQA